jgi:hypothetical protein
MHVQYCNIQVYRIQIIYVINNLKDITYNKIEDMIVTYVYYW